MKRFPKLLATLLLVALIAGILAAIPVSAAEYQAYPLKSSMMKVGHYTNTALTGDLVEHCAAPVYSEEAKCLVDNDNGSAYWSKPYKFSALKDNGGSLVPAVIFDLGADGVKIAGLDLMLRTAFDCQPLHFELQATTAAGSDNWTTLLDKKLTVDSWDNRKLRFEFSEQTVYKVRLLMYDIAEPDVAKDSYKEYTVCLGDETRFTLAEIDLLQVKSSSGSTSGTTQKPTSSGGQTATSRPIITMPPIGGQTTTTAPTKAPTQPATKAPTTVATQPATKAPTTVATQPGTVAPTTAPTQPASQTGTVAPTEAETVAPSTPVDVTEPEATVEATEPEATVEATEPEATVEATEPEATTGATEPEATTGTTDNGTTEEPKDATVIIIIAIVVALAIAGGAVFFIIKKKRG